MVDELEETPVPEQEPPSEDPAAIETAEDNDEAAEQEEPEQAS